MPQPVMTTDQQQAPRPRPPRSPRPRPPALLRTLLRGWWALAGTLAALVVGDLLGIPLAKTPTHYWDGVQDQFGALLALLTASPWQTLAAAVLVLALTLAGYLENRRVQAEERRARLAELGEAVEERLQPPLDALTAGQETVAALGAANLAVGGATLDVTTATHTAVEELREEIGDLARRAEHASATRRVFLSSTYLDLAAYRTLLHQNLGRMYQLPVDMADFGAGGTDATTVSKAEVAASDVFVLVVAWRYGYIPACATRSITHQEYDAARDLGLPTFVFLADPATAADDGPQALFPARVRDPEHARQLAQFRALLADPDRHTFETFTTPEDLSSKVVTSLARFVLRTGGSTARGRADPQGRVVALVDMPRHGKLIGRDEQLPHLLQRLTAGEDVGIGVGIFALAGMGGVGKTALAAAAVTWLADDVHAFPGGVAWIPCTDLVGASGLATLVERVARALGREDVLAEQDPARRRAALAAALARRPKTLLALDNVEPGLDAEAAPQTLAVPAHTTLLLTARAHVATHLLGVIDVPPLPAPDAAALFAERLAQATDNARPTTAEQADIPPVAAAVGGLPLAVELLAAYAGTQKTALADLRAELETEGIDATAFRTDPRRTLAKTFDRSWRVLAPRQQALFAGLSLLEGPSFPREAALALALAAAQLGTRRPEATTQAEAEVEGTERAVETEGAVRAAGAEGFASASASADAADPAGDVATLVGASLVEPLAGGRLRLHQVLRDYALRRLADPVSLPTEAAEALGAAALAYWLAYAQAHHSGSGSLDPVEMDTLEAEAPGLLGALAWAYAHARWRPLLDLVYALSQTWYLRGRRTEEAWLHPWALEAARNGGTLRDQWFMAHELALLNAQTGRVTEARAGYEEALRLARELGDKSAIQTETHELAVLDARAGRVTEARAGFEEALRLARELGDLSAQSTELQALGTHDLRQEDFARAREELIEALALARQVRQPELVAEAAWWLAELDRLEGQEAAACAGFREALVIYERLGNADADVTRQRLRSLGCAH
jgi:tetratricopeptide (TPR) repeat protein